MEWLGVRKEDGLICPFINFKDLSVSLVITGGDCASLSPDLSWEKYIDGTTFPCDFDGFKSACEWFDKQRLILAEKLL